MKKIIIVIAVVLIVVTVVLTLSGGLMLYKASNEIDYSLDEELFDRAKQETTTYYYAYDGLDLLEVWKSTRSSKREWCGIEDTGKYLIDAFIAMEDRDFYKHKGVNVKRTFLAAINQIFKFTDRFGASTITQQVIKNISGDDDQSIERKINEIMRAINLEKMHSKDDILELYVNIAPMSGNMYGVGIASEVYFGKEPRELDLHEAATIVGITNAPSRYNPYLYPDKCIEKRNKVLYAMLETEKISNEEYDTAVSQPLALRSSGVIGEVSSWFIETVREDVITDISLKYKITQPAARLMLNGAKIITTMNVKIQNILNKFFENEENLSPSFKTGMNYSMVVSDPYSGELLGIIGSAGKKSGEMLYNFATKPITPGSVMKPIALYAPLIDEGLINWSMQFNDEPLRYGSDNTPYPRNSPDVYEGPIAINEALSKSKNTVAIQLYRLLGAERIFEFLNDTLGFTTLVRDGINQKGERVTDLAEAPLALGQLTHGISLRSLTEAYGIFANDGVLCRGKSYHSVLDNTGAEILINDGGKNRVLTKECAEVMTQMLKNVVDYGTAKQISIKEIVDTAGKTGTSGGDLDRLFVGYTPYFSAGIWCGYSDKSQQVGSNYPSHLQIWDNVMKRIHNECVDNTYDELKTFPTESIVLQPYCKKSGLIPTEKCELGEDGINYGYYIEKYLPEDICNLHDDVYNEE